VGVKIKEYFNAPTANKFNTAVAHAKRKIGVNTKRSVNQEKKTINV